LASQPLSARNLHLAAMSLAGLVLGTAVVMRPGIGAGFIHPFFILILLSLAVDVGVAMLATRRPVTPLTVNARAAGFFSGAIIYLLVVWAFAAPATAV
jgi:hypothetical protein